MRLMCHMRPIGPNVTYGSYATNETHRLKL
jgi:hypothetical protein